MADGNSPRAASASWDDSRHAAFRHDNRRLKDSWSGVCDRYSLGQISAEQFTAEITSYARNCKRLEAHYGIVRELSPFRKSLPI